MNCSVKKTRFPLRTNRHQVPSDVQSLAVNVGCLSRCVYLNSASLCFPSQSSQGGHQPQSLFHAGGLSAPAPPNLPPGHSSPQASYAMQGYSLPTHQPLPHGFPSIGQLAQVGMNGFVC